MKVPSIFKNELVHYGLIFLAVLNIVGYVSARAYECLLLFGVGYYAANTYFKNVGLSILAALFFSNFIFGCGRVREAFLEGMKGAREHMLDSAVSSQKAAIELFQSADRMKRSSAFTNRSVIEAMEDMAKEETEKSAEQVDAAKALEAVEKVATDVGQEMGGEEKEEEDKSGSNDSDSNDSGSNNSGSNDGGSNDNQEDMVAARNQYRMNGMKRA